MAGDKGIALIASLDTKGEEAAYVRQCIEECGVSCLTIDFGILGQPWFDADIPREKVFDEGGLAWTEVIQRCDKGLALQTAIDGVRAIVTGLYRENKIHGVIGIGGGQGTAVATAAMRSLPLGVPKVMVSTIASGYTRPFVGISDIVMIHSVCDVGGLGTLLRNVLSNAAVVASSLVQQSSSVARSSRFSVGMTMLGTTTVGATLLRRSIEAQGGEVTVFHANGTGGEAMESLTREGFFDAIVDFSPHEVLAHIAGGIFSSGPSRLSVLAEEPIPVVVVPGGVDYIIMGGVDTMPSKHLKRRHIVHNPSITLVRATGEEMATTGELIARRLNDAKGPAGVAIPLRGFSEPNQEGRLFFDPDADQCFVRALKQGLHPEIRIVEVDAHINDDEFVRKANDLLVQLCEVEACAIHR